MKKSEVIIGLKSKSLEKFKLLRFKKYQYGIFKIDGNYRFYIGFGVVDSDNSFPSGFHYGISSKYLNNIKVKIFTDKNLKINEYSTAYGTKQEQLFDNGEYPILEYDIRTEQDIETMINDLFNFYTEKAYPILEKLTDIQELDKFINSDKVIKESMHLPTTVINGLIISKLANNPNYDSFKKKYKLLVKDWAGWDRENLQKVIDFLDSHTTEELDRIAEEK